MEHLHLHLHLLRTSICIDKRTNGYLSAQPHALKPDPEEGDAINFSTILYGNALSVSVLVSVWNSP